ncbi:hypothetical protein CYMTET_6523 [Cymbomonas tetramitiformis]|uniref:Uncharacterized protein n=1 Tax=Cymbomonas tetramitiformis TaxID=36881 RepID=A0AAE0GYT8_9CHLO|nr:hypothetical protein CYMTET_6523 [Cymbomonas tetramitiformis]
MSLSAGKNSEPQSPGKSSAKSGEPVSPHKRYKSSGIRVVGTPSNRYFFPIQDDGSLITDPVNVKGLSKHYKHFDVFVNWNQDQKEFDTTTFSPILGYSRLMYARFHPPQKAESIPLGFEPPPVPYTNDPRTFKPPSQEGSTRLPDIGQPPQGARKNERMEWLNYKSQLCGPIDVHKLAQWVSDVRPRTVHDLKPLFILMQGILKSTLNNEVQFHLKDASQLRIALYEAHENIEEMERIILNLKERLGSTKEKSAFSQFDAALAKVKTSSVQMMKGKEVENLQKVKSALEAEDRAKAAALAREKQLQAMKDQELATMQEKFGNLGDKYAALSEDMEIAKNQVISKDRQIADLKEQLERLASKMRNVEQPTLKVAELPKDKFLDWAHRLKYAEVAGSEGLHGDEVDPEKAASDLSTMGPVEAGAALTGLTTKEAGTAMAVMGPIAACRALSGCNPKLGASWVSEMLRLTKTLKDQDDRTAVLESLESLLAESNGGLMGSLMAEMNSKDDREKIDAMLFAHPDRASIQSTIETYTRSQALLAKPGAEKPEHLLENLEPQQAMWLVAQGNAALTAPALEGLHKLSATGAKKACDTLQLIAGMSAALRRLGPDEELSDLIQQFSGTLKGCTTFLELEKSFKQMMNKLKSKCGLQFRLQKVVDDSVLEPVDQAQVDAATKIQARARGMTSRKAGPGAAAEVNEGEEVENVKASPLEVLINTAEWRRGSTNELRLQPAEIATMRSGIPDQQYKKMMLPIMITPKPGSEDKPKAWGVITAEAEGLSVAHNCNAQSFRKLQQIASIFSESVSIVASLEDDWLSKVEEMLRTGIACDLESDHEGEELLKALKVARNRLEANLKGEALMDMLLEIKRYPNPPQAVLRIVVSLMLLLDEQDVKKMLDGPDLNLPSDTKPLWMATRKKIVLDACDAEYVVGKMTGIKDSKVYAAGKKVQSRFAACRKLIGGITHDEALKGSLATALLRRWEVAMIIQRELYKQKKKKFGGGEAAGEYGVRGADNPEE